MDQPSKAQAARNAVQAASLHGAEAHAYGLHSLLDREAAQAFRPDLPPEDENTREPGGAWRPSIAALAILGLVLGAVVLGWLTRHQTGFMMQRRGSIALPWKVQPPATPTAAAGFHDIAAARIAPKQQIVAAGQLRGPAAISQAPAADLPAERSPAGAVAVDVLVLTHPHERAGLVGAETLVERLRQTGHNARLVQTGRLRAKAVSVGYYYEQDRALAQAVGDLLGGQPSVHLIAGAQGGIHKPGLVVVMLP